MVHSSWKSVLAGACALTLSACGSGNGDGDIGGGGGGLAGGSCAGSGPIELGMPDEDRIYGWIEDLVGMGYRRTGTPEGERAAAYVKCEFEKLGLQDVHYETADSWNWQVSSSSMHFNGEQVDSYPTAHTFVTLDQPSEFATPSEGLTAEVVDVGRGTAAEMALHDVRGKIVMFDLRFLLPPAGFAPLMEFFWDPGLTIIEPTLVIGNPFITSYANAVEAAMAAGAVGFVGVLSDYFDSNKYHNEFYRRTQVTIPGFWVTKKVGERMREVINGTDAPPLVTLHMKGSREVATARTVVGFLPGRSSDTIMVQSHHDSVFDGAVEDASGTASVLAQAQYFASQPPGSREKTLMFATFDSHFTGYQQHRAFVQKYIIDKQTPYNIVANVTLEHIGKQGITGPDGSLQITDKSELRAIIENLGPTLKLQMINSIIKHDLRRTAMIQGHVLCPTGLLPTDAGFVCGSGIPTASLIAGPNYLYDAADTLDKVEKKDLVPVAKVFIELIDSIDATPSALIGVPFVGYLLSIILYDPLANPAPQASPEPSPAP